MVYRGVLLAVADDLPPPPPPPLTPLATLHRAGLTFQMLDPKCSLLIFHSGKVVLTGAKETDHILKAFENIFPLLLSCRSDI